MQKTEIDKRLLTKMKKKSFLFRNRKIKDILHKKGRIVEEAFSYSKEDVSLLPLRVHGEEALRGYLFFIFLSLIVYMDLQRKIGSVGISLDILRNLSAKSSIMR